MKNVGLRRSVVLILAIWQFRVDVKSLRTFRSDIAVGIRAIVIVISQIVNEIEIPGIKVVIAVSMAEERGEHVVNGGHMGIIRKAWRTRGQWRKSVENTWMRTQGALMILIHMGIIRKAYGDHTWDNQSGQGTSIGMGISEIGDGDDDSGVEGF